MSSAPGTREQHDERRVPSPTPPLSCAAYQLPVVPVVRPQHVAIIGGGMGGMTALRAMRHPLEGSLVGAGAPLEATLYERRHSVGGVWHLDRETVTQEQKAGPQATNGQWPVLLAGQHGRPSWPSPAYPRLRGNVAPLYLSGVEAPPFPPPARDEHFPSRAETESYLAAVARDYQNSIQLGTDVLGVWELPPLDTRRRGSAALPHGGFLLVAYRSANSDRGKSEVQVRRLDAVVLATGMVDYPFYPPVPGLRAAVSAGAWVHHAKWYRGPEPYCGLKVLVVGNGNSANDMASQLAQMYPDTHAYDDDPTYRAECGMSSKQDDADKTDLGAVRVYRSVRYAALSFFPSLVDRRIEDVPEIQHIELARGGDNQAEDEDRPRMHVHLLGGRILHNVDAILYGTGYRTCRFPLMRLLDRPVSPTSQDAIHARASALLVTGPAAADESLARVEKACLAAYRAGTGLARFDASDSGHQPQWMQAVEQAVWGAELARAPDGQQVWGSGLRPQTAGTAPEVSGLRRSGSCGGTPKRHMWSPERILGLHKHTLLARNPMVSLINVPTSATPFTAADAYTWYTRAVWDGSLELRTVGLEADTGCVERVVDETERVEQLRAVHERVEAQLGAATAAEPGRRLVPPRDAGSRTGWAPPAMPEHSLYHLLWPQEDVFLAQQLAQPVERAHPCLQGHFAHVPPRGGTDYKVPAGAVLEAQFDTKRRALARYARQGWPQTGPPDADACV